MNITRREQSFDTRTVFDPNQLKIVKFCESIHQVHSLFLKKNCPSFSFIKTESFVHA